METSLIERIERVNTYLPCIGTFGKQEMCRRCPYNPLPGKQWEFGCAEGQDKMLVEIHGLLKAYQNLLLHNE